jgi:hypothetical protein
VRAKKAGIGAGRPDICTFYLLGSLTDTGTRGIVDGEGGRRNGKGEMRDGIPESIVTVVSTLTADQKSTVRREKGKGRLDVMCDILSIYRRGDILCAGLDSGTSA